MDNLTELVDRYVAMWNETDAEQRRALIARIWTEDARYIDPVLQADGQADIDAMVRGVHERFPGHRVRRTGDPDAHHDRVRFAWELAPEGGPAGRQRDRCRGCDRRPAPAEHDRLLRPRRHLIARA